MTNDSGEPASPEASETGRTEGNLELFFDLVFTFAMAQVTQLVVHDPSWVAFARGGLALLAVWWTWVCYTWLTNIFETDDVSHQGRMIAAMAAMLLAAAALPTAFTSGALVFGVALLIVRLIHLGKFLAYSARDGDYRLWARTRCIAPAFVLAPACIMAAAFVAPPHRPWLWIAAAIIDYGAPLVVGMGGFRVSPSYFVERHGSIIIIALGETIVQLGAGALVDVNSPGSVGCLLLGVAISATLWWTYFGVTIVAERRLSEVTGLQRSVLARDAYSYLHLLLIAGIIAFAIGSYAAVQDHARPLPLLPALALSGGVALFYLADVAYRWRDHHQLTGDRLLAGIAAAATAPLALHVPALITMGLLTAMGAIRLSWELWRRPRIGPAVALRRAGELPMR